MKIKKFVNIINQANQESKPILAEYCQSFFCQLRGLMFRKSIPDNRGLLLVQKTDSKINASIHMMFMWMDLAVIWINNDYLVVDLVRHAVGNWLIYPKLQPGMCWKPVNLT